MRRRKKKRRKKKKKKKKKKKRRRKREMRKMKKKASKVKEDKKNTPEHPLQHFAFHPYHSAANTRPLLCCYYLLDLHGKCNRFPTF